MLIWRRSSLVIGSFQDEPTALDVDWSPELDILELPDEFMLVLSLPGVHAQDVEVTVTARTLAVTGERRHVVPQGAVVHLLESPRGAFARRVRLPQQTDVAGIRTEMGEGQLLVHVPKASSNR